MKQTLLAALALAFVLAVVGCHKQDVAADRAAIMSLVEKDTVHFSASTSHDSTTSGGYFAAGETLIFWWRGPQTHDTAVINVEINGDSAVVSWSRHNFGYLHILAQVPDTTLQLWNKNLVETVRLNAIFRREGKESDTDRGWRLKMISLATGTSDSVNTVRIDSLRIQSSLRELTIRSPLTTYFQPDSLFWFTPGEEVTVTLYTNATGGVAFLHTFVLVWPFYVRVPFNYLGDGVFQGVWHAQIVPSFRFAIFDLMTRSTIYTPDSPYDFNGWLFPYRVKTAD
uniref:Lipoprotein n=1 Tax=candidate division WOR-3 bacterium TaxID=2052148 RepID=A0A7V3PU75_UNCW3